MCLLSVVGKGYGRILINLVRKKVDGLISDDQDNFRPSKVCVDQAFVLTQLVEKTCGQYCMVLFFLVALGRCHPHFCRKIMAMM